MSGPEVDGTFERVLDQALDSRQVGASLERTDRPIDREGLRAAAVAARTAIAAAAAVEYQGYVEARSAAAERGSGPSAADEGAASTYGGGGGLALLAVLVPSLSAVAAAVFLPLGYGIGAIGGRTYIGDGLITAGLLAGAVAAGSAIGDLIWLWVAAARNRSAGEGEADPAVADPAVADPEMADPEVARARRAWELALLDRGIVPFLLDVLGETPTGDRQDHVSR